VGTEPVPTGSQVNIHKHEATDMAHTLQASTCQEEFMQYDTDKSDDKDFNELIKFPHVAFAIWTATVLFISSSLLVGLRPYLGSAAPGTVQPTLHHQMCTVVLQYEGQCVV
jgi:hypothetical protein